MKKIFIILLSILAFINTNAQDAFKDFKKQARNEYNSFKEQTEKEYNDFRDKANAEYADFMRKAWNRYKGEAPLPVIPDKSIPPVVLPDDEINVIPDNKPVIFDEVIQAPVISPEPPHPIAPIPEILQPEDKPFEFVFYGTPCKVRVSDKLSFQLKKIDEASIADAWTALSAETHNNLIRDCLELRKRMSLCDWAYLQLLETLSNRFFNNAPNEAVLLQAFLLNQSGYKIRLGKSLQNRLHLLFTSDYMLCEYPYYRIGKENFFLLDPITGNEMYIFDKAYPHEKSLSAVMNKDHAFSYESLNERTLSSERYPDVKVKIAVNKNLIDFYNTCPKSMMNNDGTTQWLFYANTPLSQVVKDKLYPVLNAAIKDKTEEEAANIIINFVQTAFEYGYDSEIWGGDRAFFPDETIHYPYSDCEDRAILFSRLVRDLLNLEVVLIYYPGHLASAVHFHEDISGDYVYYNNKRYLICDPTFIRANIGKTMTGMDNGKAKVILLNGR
jgi:hypothetical protein